MKPIPPFEMFNNKLKAQNNVQFHNEQPFVANHDQHFLMLVLRDTSLPHACPAVVHIAQDYEIKMLI